MDTSKLLKVFKNFNETKLIIDHKLFDIFFLRLQLLGPVILLLVIHFLATSDGDPEPKPGPLALADPGPMPLAMAAPNPLAMPLVKKLYDSMIKPFRY